LLSTLAFFLKVESVPTALTGFWSGCAGQAKRGLEFSGLAAVDLEDKTALHFLAV
jgi:hypothetical protein